MREFFRGYRRKTGCVTLLIACAFAAEWVTCVGRWSSKKQGAAEELKVGTDSSNVYSFVCGNMNWISFNESLIWTSRPKGDSETAPFLYWESERPTGPGCFFEFRELRWVWQSCGFGVGYFDEVAYRGALKGYELVQNPFWIVPYWSIVIPLTVMSAWLLLSRPRSNPKQPITPASENA